MPITNTERIQRELRQASDSLEERIPGYRDDLVNLALLCITVTAEHDHRKTNINQRFDNSLEEIAKRLTSAQKEPEA